MRGWFLLYEKKKNKENGRRQEKENNFNEGERKCVILIEEKENCLEIQIKITEMPLI